MKRDNLEDYIIITSTIVADNKGLDLHDNINSRLFNCWNSSECIKRADKIIKLNDDIIKTESSLFDRKKITFWKKSKKTEPKTQAKITEFDSVLQKYYKRCSNE